MEILTALKKLGECLSTEEVAFLSANMSQQVSSSPAVACALVFFARPPARKRVGVICTLKN